MKAVELAVHRALPEDLRRTSYRLDAKGVGELLAEVATKHPDQYARVSKVFVDLGRNAAWRQGETLTFADLAPLPERDVLLKDMDREVDALRRQGLDEDEFRRERRRVWIRYADLLQKTTMEKGRERLNNLTLSAYSGARGKPQQIMAMLSAPGVYQDGSGRPIDRFVRRSYGEGLRPADWLSATYGSRSSVISTKTATAKGGDFSKQLVQIGALLPVTQLDCGTDNGIDFPSDSPQLRRRVLAKPFAGMEPGTIVDRKALTKLATKSGVVIARSPLTCQAPDGVCAKCAGAGERYQLPKIGESVGITRAQSVGEPITQASLNQKHVGGQVGGKREYSGFGWIDQFVQAPEDFPDRQALAEDDGTVTSVKEAPQGGTYVTVNDTPHYVPPGIKVTAVPGQKVEKGQSLSEGLASPADVLRLRGLGEARRYYAERFKKLMDDSGMDTDQLHTETVARAALSHVAIRADDGLGDLLPDDVTSYERLMTRLKLEPRKLPRDQAVGKYLARPALHYTVGTHLSPSMLDRLGKAGFEEVETVDDPPEFEASMTRLRSAAHDQDDWLGQMHTSYLKANVADSAMRGLDTNVEANTHFAPRLAVGVGFGEKVRETGKF